MTRSLHGRLLISATVVLAAFLGLTGLALDRAFRTSAESNVEEHLQAQLFGLLAAADLDENGNMIIAEPLPEPRFSTPESDLYARITDNAGNVIWRSESFLGVDIPVREVSLAGARSFSRIGQGDNSHYVLNYDAAWENVDHTTRTFTFTVAENLSRYQREVNRFRRSLAISLAAVTMVLLAVQAMILRWGLTPLRKVADEIAEVESGRKEALSSDYPEEISSLTHNINAFIKNERNHLKRYRNTLGDLAHSLKTPMAVLRGILDSNVQNSKSNEEAREQINRMNNIVEYQLHKAATAGHTTLSAPVNVQQNVRKVIQSLQKVYSDKSVTSDIDVPNDLDFYGEEGDLLEILGNLSDNAFKWCRSRVNISARAVTITGSARNGVDFCIQDDGPGIPEDMRQLVTQRGVRSDGFQGGQGIGLAVVRDIVESYGGELKLSTSELGGAQVDVHINP